MDPYPSGTWVEIHDDPETIHVGEVKSHFQRHYYDDSLTYIVHCDNCSEDVMVPEQELRTIRRGRVDLSIKDTELFAFGINPEQVSDEQWRKFVDTYSGVLESYEADAWKAALEEING